MLGPLELSFCVTDRRRACRPLFDFVDHDVTPSTHRVVDDLKRRGAPPVVGDAPHSPSEDLAVVPRSGSDHLAIDEKLGPEALRVAAACNTKDEDVALERERSGPETTHRCVALGRMIARHEPIHLAYDLLLAARGSSDRPPLERLAGG